MYEILNDYCVFSCGNKIYDNFDRLVGKSENNLVLYYF